jgi:cytochrome c oxidase subunit 2
MNVRFWPEQASEWARQTDALLLFLLAVSLFFAIGIAIAIIYYCVKYRAGSPANRDPLEIPLLPIEVTWTAIPLAIALVIFGWGAKLYFDLQRPPADALEVAVVGKQWMWKTQHAEGAQEINELHIPLGRAVKLTMTSQDVIHSFYIPAFRLKQDVVPGRYTTEWFRTRQVGTFHLFCSEFCGTDHARMIGRIIVMDPSDYAQWLKAGSSQPTAAAAGGQLYGSLGCASCHDPGAKIRAPLLTGRFGQSVQLRDGRVVPVDESYVRKSIIDPQSEVVAGYEPIMPTFHGQLNEEQILQIIAYLKTLPSGVSSR